MTTDEKIKQLENRIEMLELLVKALQQPNVTIPAYPVYVPQQPVVPYQPYWVTCQTFGNTSPLNNEIRK